MKPTPSSTARSRHSGSLLAVALVSLALMGLAHAAHGPRPVDASTRTVLESRLGQMPLTFVENRGQVTGPVSHYVRGRDKTLYFTPDGLTYSLAAQGEPPESSQVESPTGASAEGTPGSRWTVKLSFEDARRVTPEGVEQAEGVVSYFSGKPSEWKTGLKTYRKLRYERLWPGIDLAYSGTVNRVKYEFVVAPGADPDQIRLAYEGATDVKLTGDGALEVKTPVGSFQDAKPYAYQEIGGTRVEVECRYMLSPPGAGGSAGTARYGYGFRLGGYDRSRPLVLDPAVLVYCGYLGGADDDRGGGVKADAQGNLFIGGSTQPGSTTFPLVVGPDLSHNGLGDCFIAKLNPSGTAFLYCGYIGGTSGEQGGTITVDSNGNAYFCGSTGSTEAQEFPVVGGPDLTSNGSSDIFVAKINPQGTALLYCGYLGGAGLDFRGVIDVDDEGRLYVAGLTQSSEASFPETGEIDGTYGGDGDGFIARVNAAGTALDYCSYIGGFVYDQVYGIAVDGDGNAYLAGETRSRPDQGFPVVGDLDPIPNAGGRLDGFVMKINPQGTAIVYSGYVGGGGDDAVDGIALDTARNAYLVGRTTSPPGEGEGFPVKVGPDLTYNDSGNGDSFVAKVNAAGTGLVFCGYIGGFGNDQGRAIGVDDDDNVYAYGVTMSDETTFPVVGGPDSTHGGDIDAWIAKVAASGGRLVYCGFIGGAGRDLAVGMSVTGAGDVYAVGTTSSDQWSFPVLTGPDLTYNGARFEGDAFVCKISTVSLDSYEPDNTAAAAKPLVPGQTQSRNLHAQGNRDWAKFTLAAPASIALETSGAGGDTLLYLYGPNSSTALVTYNNNSGPGTGFSRIERASLAAGTYYALVVENGNNATLPAYTLSLTTGAAGIIPDRYERDDLPTPAKPLAPGETQNRSIHVAGNRDWARFTLSAPSSIALETDGPVGDTILYLYGPNSATTAIASNDNRSGSTFSRLPRPSLGPGIYYVLVVENGNNATIPAYTLTLRTGAPGAVPDAYEADDTSAAAKTIAAGETQSRSLHATGDRDWAKFTLASTSRVTLETNGSSGDTVLYLYGPNSPATGIASNNDRPGSTFSRIVRPSLGPGTYYVLVIENGNDAPIPAYTLRLTTAAPPGAETALGSHRAPLTPARKG